MRRVESATWQVEERIATCCALTREGYSAAQIAVRLGITQRAVVRYRSRARNEGRRLGRLQHWEPLPVPVIDPAEVALYEMPSGDDWDALNFREQATHRRNAIIAYSKAGKSSAWIALRLGMDRRTVIKRRSEYRAAGRLPQCEATPERISA